MEYSRTTAFSQSTEPSSAEVVLQLKNELQSIVTRLRLPLASVGYPSASSAQGSNGMTAVIKALNRSDASQALEQMISKYLNSKEQMRQVSTELMAKSKDSKQRQKPLTTYSKSKPSIAIVSSPLSTTLPMAAGRLSDSALLTVTRSRSQSPVGVDSRSGSITAIAADNHKEEGDDSEEEEEVSGRRGRSRRRKSPPFGDKTHRSPSPSRRRVRHDAGSETPIEDSLSSGDEKRDSIYSRRGREEDRGGRRRRASERCSQSRILDEDFAWRQKMRRKGRDVQRLEHSTDEDGYIYSPRFKALDKSKKKWRSRLSRRSRASRSSHGLSGARRTQTCARSKEVECANDLVVVSSDEANSWAALFEDGSSMIGNSVGGIVGNVLNSCFSRACGLFPCAVVTFLMISTLSILLIFNLSEVRLVIDSYAVYKRLHVAEMELQVKENMQRQQLLHDMEIDLDKKKQVDIHEERMALIAMADNSMQKFIESNTHRTQEWGFNPFKLGTRSQQKTKTLLTEDELRFFRHEILGYVSQALVNTMWADPKVLEQFRTGIEGAQNDLLAATSKPQISSPFMAPTQSPVNAGECHDNEYDHKQM